MKERFQRITGARGDQAPEHMQSRELSSVHKADGLFLNVAEAAALLKVKIATIYAWVHQRRIPFRHHGTRLVFYRLELEEWSAAQAVRPVDDSLLGLAVSAIKNRPCPKKQGNSSLKTSSIAEGEPISKKEKGDGSS